MTELLELIEKNLQENSVIILSDLAELCLGAEEDSTLIMMEFTNSLFDLEKEINICVNSHLLFNNQQAIFNELKQNEFDLVLQT